MSLLVKNLSINDVYMDAPSTDPKPDIVEDQAEEEEIEVWTVHGTQHKYLPFFFWSRFNESQTS